MPFNPNSTSLCPNFKTKHSTPFPHLFFSPLIWNIQILGGCLRVCVRMHFLVVLRSKYGNMAYTHRHCWKCWLTAARMSRRKALISWPVRICLFLANTRSSHTTATGATVLYLQRGYEATYKCVGLVLSLLTSSVSSYLLHLHSFLSTTSVTRTGTRGVQ